MYLCVFINKLILLILYYTYAKHITYYYLYYPLLLSLCFSESQNILFNMAGSMKCKVL